MPLDPATPNETEADTGEPFLSLTPADVALTVQSFGTPVFIYDDEYFRKRAQTFLDVWRAKFINSSVFLSYKTNYLPEMCRTAHETGMGADVVSAYELEHAVRLCHNGPIVFNGPQKKSAELKRSADVGATINIDLEEEIDRLVDLRSRNLISNVRVGLRVNPGVGVLEAPDSSFFLEHTKKQGSSKFGWPLESSEPHRIARRIIESGFALESVHAHLSSQITDKGLLLQALGRVIAFVADLRKHGVNINEINIGGGFGVGGMLRSRQGWWSELKRSMGEVSEQPARREFDIVGFVSDLSGQLAGAGLDAIRVSTEPGRFLMSASVVLVSTVLGVKRLRSKTWVVIDGGLNILSTASVGELRRLRFVRDGREMPSESLTTVTIGGPLCYEGDVVMAEAEVPSDIRTGDLIVISDAGAYSISRSTNFNQPRAAVAMRTDTGSKLIWRRETYDDIFSFSVS